MRKIILLTSTFLLFIRICNAQLSVGELLTENQTNPIGISAGNPRLSWKILTDLRNITQLAYEVKVNSEKQIIWNSGKVMSDRSVQVPYGGSGLESGKKYEWQVRVWTNSGKPTTWSTIASFQMALLHTSDWKAKWIEPGYTEDQTLRPSPIFRKPFTIPKQISTATAFITSHGLYEAKINGQKIGDAYFTPGWTSYNKRLQYQVYDVTPMIKKGNNVIGVTLGNGWYRGIIGFSNNKNVYGKDIALLMQINITYSDGTTDIIASDGTWRSSMGEIQYGEIYNGEMINAGMEKKGWLMPGYNDTEWYTVKVADFPMENLVNTENEPVKKHEMFHPLRIFNATNGDHLVDFGQNLVGWVIVKVKGKKGDTIRISHAEVLDKEGNFYTENLRQAKAQDVYILKGGEEETFEPHFTWHGFQFIKVEGYPGELKPANFIAVTLYSDMKPSGSFSTSNALINQLQKNIQWGQKGNFLDVPTDCPQRDERLGWTGDAQVFSRTASFNMNVNNFFAKWLKDITADQENGVVPFVIPNVLGSATSSTGWADVATIIPWNMYLAYGDKKILENQYEGMKAYIESIKRIAVNNLWNSGFHFGDWLFYRPEDDNDGRAAVTDKYLIAQCFYANSTRLLIKAATVLDKKDDVSYYTGLLEKIKKAFIDEYVTPNGRLVSSTQTAYVLALNFDMFPQDLRKQAAERLVENIKSYGYHLTTGFLGTPYLCHVLSRFGYTDVAYKLLLQQSYPSWLYPVKMGATTIWERWDGIKPDKTFQTPGMNSFNHYSYGAIGDWMYRVMAGIDTYEDGPGYKHIIIKPYIGGGFTFAKASLQTYFGTVSDYWQIENDQLTMEVEIPANTTADVYVPGAAADNIRENTKLLKDVKEITIAGEEDGYVKLKVGSGKYNFKVPFKIL